MQNLREITLQKRMDDLFQGYFWAGQVASDGSLLLVYTKEAEIDFFERPIKPQDWLIYQIKATDITAISLKNITLLPDFVDVLTDDTILVVQSRCEKTTISVEKNAAVFTKDGQKINTFTLGDGIEHVQVDDANQIWVGYFDEGVFGNFGWENPIGTAGLAMFNQSGKKIWEEATGKIVDCYALNVVNQDEVYYHYYDDFHTVKLQGNKEVARYRMKNGNSLDQFIFTQSDEVIAEVDSGILQRFRVEHHAFIPQEKISLVNETGKKLNGQLFMRGNQLYLFGRKGIYHTGF